MNYSRNFGIDYLYRPSTQAQTISLFVFYVSSHNFGFLRFLSSRVMHRKLQELFLIMTKKKIAFNTSYSLLTISMISTGMNTKKTNQIHSPIETN